MTIKINQVKKNGEPRQKSRLTPCLKAGSGVTASEGKRAKHCTPLYFGEIHLHNAVKLTVIKQVLNKSKKKSRKVRPLAAWPFKHHLKFRVSQHQCAAHPGLGARNTILHHTCERSINPRSNYQLEKEPTSVCVT